MRTLASPRSYMGGRARPWRLSGSILPHTDRDTEATSQPSVLCACGLTWSRMGCRDRPRWGQTRAGLVAEGQPMQRKRAVSPKQRDRNGQDGQAPGSHSPVPACVSVCSRCGPQELRADNDRCARLQSRPSSGTRNAGGRLQWPLHFIGLKHTPCPCWSGLVPSQVRVPPRTQPQARTLSQLQPVSLCLSLGPVGLHGSSGLGRPSRLLAQVLTWSPFVDRTLSCLPLGLGGDPDLVGCMGQDHRVALPASSRHS